MPTSGPSCWFSCASGHFNFANSVANRLVFKMVLSQLFAIDNVFTDSENFTVRTRTCTEEVKQEREWHEESEWH